VVAVPARLGRASRPSALIPQTIIEACVLIRGVASASLKYWWRCSASPSTSDHERTNSGAGVPSLPISSANAAQSMAGTTQSEHPWREPHGGGASAKFAQLTRLLITRINGGPVRSQSAAEIAASYLYQQSQPPDLHLSISINTASRNKRPRSFVRDEEAVGSNPATPTLRCLGTSCTCVR
jgi:hypothetical protein